MAEGSFDWTGLGALGTGIGALGSMATSFLNYGLSSKNFDYQKELQNRVFAREDTSLQRRMQDAKAAGLNPYSVINSGGASSGNVVRTEAPQMNLNTNGLIDTVSSILDIKQRQEQTKSLQLENANKAKTGLILDADLTSKDWQNKILGNEFGMSYLNNHNAFLQTLWNQADFNYNFGTDWQLDYQKSDNGVDGTYYYWKMFDKSGKGPVFGNQAGTPFYDRNWYLDKDVEYNNANLFYDKMINQNWYNNYAFASQGYQADMLKFSKELMDKQNAWYNWNQGFDMVTGAIDAVSGILFKNLDLGLRKAMNNSQINLNSSSAYRNYSQAWRNYYGK